MIAGGPWVEQPTSAFHPLPTPTLALLDGQQRPWRASARRSQRSSAAAAAKGQTAELAARMTPTTAINNPNDLWPTGGPSMETSAAMPLSSTMACPSPTTKTKIEITKRILDALRIVHGKSLSISFPFDRRNNAHPGCGSMAAFQHCRHSVSQDWHRSCPLSTHCGH
jgi:hypothetical protein